MLLRKTPLLLLLLITGFASCKKANVTPPNTNKGKNLVLTSVEQQKVTADNAFSLKLFKNLDSANTGNANLFASPLSVSFALGMTSNGANGQTHTAMLNALDFNGYVQDQVNTYFQTLITQLPQLDPNTTINIANSIWYKQGFSVLPAFLSTNSTFYNATVQALDFSSPASANTINNWVSEQTKGAISTIVDQISALDIMYLVNAIYFKSSWNERFDVAKTSDLPFFLDDNSQVQASFMDGIVDYNRYDDNNVDVFELPYSNSKYSMVIVMPAAGSNTSLHQLVSGIDSTKWSTWMTGLRPVNAELKLPKFKFSYSINLNNALTTLGMGIAFTPAADFSLINATMHLQISKVLQKAYIEVDETGTTAAAATVVILGFTVSANPPPTVINRPFLFAIRETNSGLLLFTGTVHNPNSPPTP